MLIRHKLENTSTLIKPLISNSLDFQMDVSSYHRQELKQYPSLRVEVTNAACEALDRMKEESRRATVQLVDMETSYLTVEFFRKLPQDIEKGGNPTHSIFDRYNDSYLRRIGEYKRKKLEKCLYMIMVILYLHEKTRKYAI